MNNKFSKIGFILAIAGSAVGLGTAWKFPYMVGNNGGSAFLLIFLLFTTIGLTVLIAEMSIGKMGQSDPVECYEKLAPKKVRIWRFAGFCMIGALIICSFYSVIVGWIIRYAVLTITHLPSNIDESKEIFINLISKDYLSQILFFSIAFCTTFYIVSKGVKEGIEKCNIYLMPAFFILVVLMLIYSTTMNGFVPALKFMLIPDFSKLNVHSFLDALGLSFFTLSIGVGSIITYSASLNEQTNIPRSAAIVAVINVIIGLMMGFVIFTFIFEFGGEPAQGAGLAFISLPTLFGKLGGFSGHLFAVLFFVAMIFAGITSAVSMIEPFTMYLMRAFKIKRKKALIIIGCFIYTFGILSILSNVEGTKEYLVVFGKPFFDFLDYMASNIIMPIGSILSAIFIGFIVKKRKTYKLLSKFMSKKAFNIWLFCLKYLAPIMVVTIMFYTIIKG